MKQRISKRQKQQTRKTTPQEIIIPYVPYIPDEIIYHIASYLPGYSVCKLVVASKRFQILLDENKLWEERTRKEFLTTHRKFLSPYFDTDFGLGFDSDSDDEDAFPSLKIHEDKLPCYFSAKEKYVLRYMDSHHKCSFCYCTLDMEHSHFIDYFAACSSCRQVHLSTEKDMKLKFALTEPEINTKIKKINGSAIYSFTREIKTYLNNFKGGVEAEVARRKSAIDKIAKKKGSKITHNENRWRYNYYIRLMKEGIPTSKAAAIANNTIYRALYLRRDKMDTLIQERTFKYKWNHRMYDYFEKITKRKPEHHERVRIRALTSNFYSLNPVNSEIPDDLKKNIKDLNNDYTKRGKMKKELDKKISKVTNRKYSKVDDLPFRLKKKLEEIFSIAGGDEDFVWDRFIQNLDLNVRAPREEEFKKEMEKAGYNYTVANLPNEAESFLDGKNDWTFHQAVTATMIDFQNKFRLGSALKHTKAPKSIRSLTAETKQDLSKMYLETLFNNFSNKEEEENEHKKEEVDEEYYKLEWTKAQKNSFAAEFCNLIAKVDPKMAIHFMRSKAFVDIKKNEDLSEEEEEEYNDSMDTQDVVTLCQNSKSSRTIMKEEEEDFEQSSSVEKVACSYNLRKRKRIIPQQTRIQNDEETIEAPRIVKKLKK